MGFTSTCVTVDASPFELVEVKTVVNAVGVLVVVWPLEVSVKTWVLERVVLFWKLSVKGAGADL